MSLDSTGRRRFIGSALSTAAALALLKDSPVADGVPGTADLTFFDRRFARARELALELANGGTLRPVDGDPTEVAFWIQSYTSRGQPRRRIRGVTVESVPFCLKTLNPRSGLWLRRIDRDLFVWTI